MMTREVIARAPPPAFLFPINDVKDPTGNRFHRLTPGGGEERGF